MREAYGSTSVDTARKRLRSLLSWLESNGHEDAAGRGLSRSLLRIE